MDIIHKLILTALMCGLLNLPAVYANEKSGEQRDQMKMSGMIFEGLNLTEEQKKQLHANKDKKMQQMKGLREQMKAVKEALHKELMKTQMDMNKIKAVHGQIKALQNKIADERLNSILEVRKILTPEQFNKFIGMMKERRKQWQGNHFKGAMKDADAK